MFNSEPQPMEIAQKFLNHKYYTAPLDGKPKELTLRYWQQDFYVYRDGRYYEKSIEEIKEELAVYFSQAMTPIEQTTHRLNNTVLALRAKTRIPNDTKLNSWLPGLNDLRRESNDEQRVLSMANGIIELPGNHSVTKEKFECKKLKHSPLYFTLTKLPYDYDPLAECPGWLAFLNIVMLDKKDYVRLLQQWCGYLFRPDLYEQKFLMCFGDAQAGKGTFFEVVTALVDIANCSQVRLPLFTRPFAMYESLGKIVNMSTESGDMVNIEAENVLKILSAGDQYFDYERKHRQPVRALPTAKIMIATNDKPRFNDKTRGTWRRLILIPFGKKISDESQIKNYAGLLKKELPGILNWALAGMKDLNATGSFSIPESNAVLFEEYRQDSDPTRAYLLGLYKFDEAYTDGPETKAMYASYKQYCVDNTYSHVSHINFGKAVYRVFPDIKIPLPQKRRGAARVRVYLGLVKIQDAE